MDPAPAPGESGSHSNDRNVLKCGSGRVIPGSGTKSVAVYRAEKEIKMYNSLPRVSAYSHPTRGDLIFVCKGREGYWKAKDMGVVDDDLTADVWNAAHNISKAEAEAMFSGSMWSWDVPAAYASSYDSEGRLVHHNRKLDD